MKVRIEIELDDFLLADIETVAQLQDREVGQYIAKALYERIYGFAAARLGFCLVAEVDGVHRARRMTRELRAATFEKSGGACHYCGMRLHPLKGWNADHVVPFAKGGECRIENLVAACSPCNRKKSTKSADAFYASIKSHAA